MSKVRKVEKKDVPLVKDLLSRTWIDTYGDFLSPQTIERVTSEWHHPDRLAAQAEDSETFFSCIEVDGKIVGLITVSKIDALTLFLYRLYIDPSMQRKGLGSQLLESVANNFPEAEKICLEVEKLNEKGKSFYLKNGFKIVGEREDIMGEDRMEVLIMEKVLTPLLQ